MKFLVLWLVASSLYAKPAPLFHADVLGGGKLSLAENLKPGRGTLVSFWATWCSPCMEELKHLAKVLGKDSKIPIDVITVNVDTSETSSDVRSTARLEKILFPIALDPTHRIFGKYNAEKALPYSVLLNGQGTILKSFQGYQPDMVEQMQAALRVAN